MTEKLLQAIRADGSADKKMEGGLSPEDLRKLYRVMVTTRVLGERAEAAQRTGKIGFYVPTIGQEASHVASAAAMEASDWIFPSYRDVGIALWRGVPVREIADQLFGNARDLTKGRQMPVHYSFPKGIFVSVSSPIGTQIVQATGAAMAAKIRGDRRVVSVYFGDGATSSNDFHTGLNFAGVFKAPVVFICENNQWAISIPVHCQTACPTMAQKAVAYGFDGVRVDGNDALAVYTATKAAVDKARAETAAAFKDAEKVPAPPLESLFEDVYSDLPWHLRDQRASLLAEGREHEKDEGAAFPL
jgi:pyruvate dehydrogenase E1 component alpha subunit